MQFDYSNIQTYRDAGMGMYEAKRHIEKQQLLKQLEDEDDLDALRDAVLYLVRKL